MKLYLDNEPPGNIQSECLVIGVTEGGALSPAATGADEASGGTIGRMLKAGDIETTLGKVNFVHNVPGLAAERLLTVGFGKVEKLDLARFDRACQAAGKALRDHTLTCCHVTVHELDIPGTNPEQRLKQAALAIHRANYLYSATKPVKEESPAPLKQASFQGTLTQIRPATR